MIDERWRAARRILAVRLDNLGDLLVTTPAIHAIKASLPGIELTLLTSPVAAQAGRLNPDIDDVIIYQAPWMDPWQRLPQDSEREQRMITTVRDSRFARARYRPRTSAISPASRSGWRRRSMAPARC